jgi:hypothetical protein
VVLHPDGYPAIAVLITQKTSWSFSQDSGAESGLKHLPYQAKAANRVEHEVGCLAGQPLNIVR